MMWTVSNILLQTARDMKCDVAFIQQFSKHVNSNKQKLIIM